MAETITEMERSRAVDSPGISVCPKWLGRSSPTTSRWPFISMNFRYFQWILLKMIGFPWILSASKTKRIPLPRFAFDSGTFSFGFWHYCKVPYKFVEAKYFFRFFSSPPGQNYEKWMSKNVPKCLKIEKNVSNHVLDQAETKKNEKYFASTKL